MKKLIPLEIQDWKNIPNDSYNLSVAFTIIADKINKIVEAIDELQEHSNNSDWYDHSII
jgi:hypothetical protein